MLFVKKRQKLKCEVNLLDVPFIVDQSASLLLVKQSLKLPLNDG